MTAMVACVDSSAIDQEWLDALNKERRADQESTVSYEVFEIIIDRLEKEWFELVCPCWILLGHA